MQRISLYWHTLRHLRLKQLAYQLFYRLRRPSLRALAPVSGRCCFVPGQLVAAIARPVSLSQRTFTFLNQSQTFSASIDWDYAGYGKLWTYNLNYFDYLNQPGLSASDGLELMRDFLRDLPSRSNGLEPYPTSLRIVNWIKWALAGNDLPPDAVQSLVGQARLLSQRLEYHLLGNHLFANAKALIFAGLFLQGEEAEEWLSRGLKILDAELSEQILPDGGNFERSPMYHAIILEDLLDLINLFRTFGREISVDWEDAYIRMRAWLKAMTLPDGEIALFNDAAFGIAPNWSELDAYAGRLGLSRQDYPPRPLTRFPETSYVRCEREAAVLLLDVAPIGPDYIPGHAHADTLNFELSLFGQRVIVDSGTSTYEKSAERQRQRGTAAHNTVTINGEDSSEVWGGFRVARRARPFDLETAERGGKVRVACAHDGYRRLPGKPVHRREWVLGENSLTIKDSISGKFQKAVGRLHFHPDCQVALGAVQQVNVDLPGGEVLRLDIKGGKAELVDTTYHPEFGLSIPNKCLEVVFLGRDGEVTFSWA